MFRRMFIRECLDDNRKANVRTIRYACLRWRQFLQDHTFILLFVGAVL